MEICEILPHIFGALALIITPIVFLFNDKKKILILFILINIFYAIEYLLLGAFSGAATCIVGLVRSCVYYHYEKNKKQKSVGVLIFFMLLIGIMGIFTYNGIKSLVPIISAIMYAYGTWQSDMKIFRKIAIVDSTLWVIYNTLVGAYVSIIATVIELTSAIIALIRFDKKERKNKGKIKEKI